MLFVKGVSSFSVLIGLAVVSLLTPGCNLTPTDVTGTWSGPVTPTADYGYLPDGDYEGSGGYITCVFGEGNSVEVSDGVRSITGQYDSAHFLGYHAISWYFDIPEVYNVEDKTGYLASVNAEFMVEADNSLEGRFSYNGCDADGWWRIIGIADLTRTEQE